jgi:hypothetical protein
VAVCGLKTGRDFSLRRPTISQEVKWKEKASACSVRNDGVWVAWVWDVGVWVGVGAGG